MCNIQSENLFQLNQDFYVTSTYHLGCTNTPFLPKYRCLSSVFFFFHFSDMVPMRYQNSGHASSEKKKIHRFWQMDRSLPLILWYTQTKKAWVWEIITVKVETHSPTLPLPAALCPLPVLNRADRRVDELHRQSLCPLSLPISLSLSAWTSSLFCDFSLHFFFFFFCFGWVTGVTLLTYKL